MNYCFGEFELDEDERELRRGSEQIVLQPLIFDLLALLVRNRSRVVSKDELLRRLWPGAFVTESSLHRAVSVARSALDDEAHEIIRNFSGRGYRFCAGVREKASASSAVADPLIDSSSLGRPHVEYATACDGVRIAFSTIGTGPALVHIMAPGGHIQQQWEVPEFVNYHSRLAEHRMLVHYDHRGTGLSQRNVEDFSLDTFLADLNAVADKLGLRRFALWGTVAMGQVAMAYAVKHPERISHLLLWHSYARGSDWTGSPGVQALRRLSDNWELFTDTMAHYTFGWSGGEAARRYAARLRDGVTRDTYRAMVARANRFDVSDLLPLIKAPTLVLHRRRFPLVGDHVARDLAARIPNARLVLLEGDSAGYALGDSLSVLRAVEEFLAIDEPPRPPNFRSARESTEL